jgi:hypothetical protein
MRAPRRPREEIIADASKLLAPPTETIDKWRARISDCIHGLWLVPREHIRTRDIKKSLATYEKALRAARKASVSFPLWQFIPPNGEFIKQVDEQLAAVERYKGTKWEKDKGAKLLDLDAEAAVQAARDLIEERGLKPTVSPKSAWHRLSQLLYESITGTANKNVMHYLRHWKPEGPTDEEIEEMISISRVRNDA